MHRKHIHENTHLGAGTIKIRVIHLLNSDYLAAGRRYNSTRVIRNSARWITKKLQHEGKTDPEQDRPATDGEARKQADDQTNRKSFPTLTGNHGIGFQIHNLSLHHLRDYVAGVMRC